MRPLAYVRRSIPNLSTAGFDNVNGGNIGRYAMIALYFPSVLHDIWHQHSTDIKARLDND